jgi:hypothetical protein
MKGTFCAHCRNSAPFMAAGTTVCGWPSLSGCPPSMVADCGPERPGRGGTGPPPAIMRRPARPGLPLKVRFVRPHAQKVPFMRKRGGKALGQPRGTAKSASRADPAASSRQGPLTSSRATPLVGNFVSASICTWLR